MASIVRKTLGSIKWKSLQMSWGLLKALCNTVTIHTKHGLMTVYTKDSIIGKWLYLAGEYQHDLCERTLEFLRTQNLIPEKGRGTVLDLGANIGVISIGMLVNKEFEYGIAVEPDPDNFALCKKNAAQNELLDKYYAFQYAVSEKNGQVDFGLCKDNLGDHRVFLDSSKKSQTDRESILVEARTIDSIVNQLPPEVSQKLSLVWIDVQGHEGFAFLGGEDLFKRRIPVVSEIWPYGIEQSGMGISKFCEIAAKLWTHFYAWDTEHGYTQHSINMLNKYCRELGNNYDDIIFVNLYSSGVAHSAE